MRFSGSRASGLAKTRLRLSQEGPVYFLPTIAGISTGAHDVSGLEEQPPAVPQHRAALVSPRFSSKHTPADKGSTVSQTLTRAARACACQADVGCYANFTVRVATTLPSTSMLNTTRPWPSWCSARLDR
jgi:hypothetical protein